MKFKSIFAGCFVLALSIGQALAQATILPPGMTCFQATAGVNGMLGVLGTITGGSSYTNGSYGGVPLTGGSGSGATANVTVSGGIVTQLTVLNPGIQYVIGDVLSAAAANIGGTGSGFSVPVAATSINSSLAGGSVTFYIPGTQAVKQTWQDAGQTILNQNPVILDQNGCAQIYGSGIYRQILQDSLTNTVWDKPTASTSPVGVYWAGLAGGTGNAITITDTSFALQDGATIQFLANAVNTGPTTLQVSGGAAISIVEDTSSGPFSLAGGEIGIGNTPIVTYDAANALFHLVNPAVSGSTGGAGSSLTPPTGYLNLVGVALGTIQPSDVANASTIYYSPYVGDTIPIWNGSAFRSVVFSEMTTTLTASGSAANAIQDLCVFSNNGVPTLVVGPAWSSSTPGAGARGSGAGSAQIGKLQGIWVNSNVIIGYNGTATYSIPQNQCTYVGSVSIDATAGLVSAYRSYGQDRKFGIWNAYNRQQIYMIAGDSTASWSYTTNAIRPANNNIANQLQVFSGLPEEPYSITLTAYLTGNNALNEVTEGQIGIGYNSTTAFTGQIGQQSLTNSAGTAIVVGLQLNASLRSTPALGINTMTALENGLGGTHATWNGGETYMILSAGYRG